MMKKLLSLAVFLVCCFPGVMFPANAEDACSKGPLHFTEGENRTLVCDFHEPVQAVYWYKDKMLLTNGSEGLYHSEDRLSDVTLRSTLHFPTVRFEHKGNYTCKADHSQNRRCPNGDTSYVQVNCDSGYILAADKTVSVKEFSNATLKCSALSWDNCYFDAALTWHYENKTLENSNKYTIRKQKTTSKCTDRLIEEDFVLEISNVTNADTGEYACQLDCMLMERTGRDSIMLTNYFEPERETTVPGTPQKSTRSQAAPWIIAVVCAAVVAIIFAVMCALKNKIFTRNRRFRYDGAEDILTNKLFISYSTKDFGWVAENLISLLEKHSIPYSIHIRDFELGRPIVQNMADSVYNSRQVLIVLSNNYLASNFCREELHMAVQRGEDTGDSSLVLVTIDKLKKRQLPSALRGKNLLDFEKHKKKQDWEKKLLGVVLEDKTASA